MKTSLPKDRVPRALVCRWAGVKEPTHARWAARGIVRDPGPLGCDLADAIEVVVVARLFEGLGPDDARLAYAQLRDQVRELSQLDSILDVVWDVRLQKATLVKREVDLAPLVRTGHEFRVIPFADHVTEVIAAHRRAVTDRWARARSHHLSTPATKHTVQLTNQ